MSLHPQAFCPISEEMVRVAQASYPKGNVYTLPTILQKNDTGA